jgi:hypothetical protein
LNAKLRWGHCADNRLESAPQDKIRKSLLGVRFDGAREAKAVESPSWEMKLELSRAVPYSAYLLLPDKTVPYVRAVVVVGWFLSIECLRSRTGLWRYLEM